MNTSYIDVEAIKAAYAPYHTMPEFAAGYRDGLANISCPYGKGGVAEQAYDRGLEAAMKVQRAARWIEANVGAD